MSTTAKERYEVINRLQAAGISYEHAHALRRISMTLHRWRELECGTGTGHIERHEDTGVPYYYRDNHSYVDPHDPRAHYRVPDKEKGALKRLQAIVSHYPDFIAYHQTDPRGCAVYMVRKSDVPEGTSIDSVYNRGIAVY